MTINHTTHKAKAVICFCLILAVNGLTAQNIETYKYIITPIDISPATNVDILEINNHYYILSDGWSYISSQTIPTINIFDEDLNSVEQILLPEGERGFRPYKFFYEKKIFYILGTILDSHQISKPCFAKFDKEFNLVQPFSLYNLDDSLNYYFCNIIMTKKSEFMNLIDVKGREGRLWYINNNGEFLQEVILPYKIWGNNGSIVETDSNYFVDSQREEYLLRFPKDSLEKYDSVYVELCVSCSPEGTMVAVGNQFLRSNSYVNFHEECTESGEIAPAELDRSIDFLNEDMSVKKSLIFGKPCAHDNDGSNNMDYINPDSIYYAYGIGKESVLWIAGISATISVACFSSEGELHFNHTFNIPDTIRSKEILKCKALSNGGVLISGIAVGLSSTVAHQGFLLYYHPTKGVKIKEYAANTNIRVYPNPTPNQLRITNYELRSGAEYSIYSVVGQKVLQGKLQDETSVISLAPLAKGMYFLRVGEKTVKVVRE